MRATLLRLGAVVVLGLLLTGCDKCGDFVFKSQAEACRGTAPVQR